MKIRKASKNHQSGTKEAGRAHNPDVEGSNPSLLCNNHLAIILNER